MKILPDAVFKQHMIALGKTRSGKSSAFRYLLEQRLDDGARVCIVDPKGDWWGLKSSASGKSAGYPVVIFGGEHADIPLNDRAGAHVAELVATGNRPCIIDLGGWHVAERTRFFIDFASTLFRTNRGPMLLAIDEVHNFAPQGKIMDPDAGKMLHWSNRLASEGSGKGIIMLAASQRPQKVHKDFVTSMETLLAFRVIHKLDREAIKDWMEGAGDPEKAREILAGLAMMPRGDAWAWSPEIAFGPAKVSFPMFKTYDSFKAPEAGVEVKLKGWADVNLDDVRLKMAEVVKQAEANDPAKLKARIRELEAAAKKGQPSPAKTVTVPDERAIARAVAERDRHWQGEVAKLDKAVKLTTGRLGQIAKLAHLNGDLPVMATPPAIRIAPAPVKQTRNENRQTVVVRAPDAEPEGLTSRHADIMEAVRLCHAMGYEAPTREQVMFWSRKRGSNFRNLIGALRSAGEVEYPTEGTVRAVTEGEVPDTAEAYRRAIGDLEDRHCCILDAVLAADGPITRDKLQEASGKFGSNFRNLIGALRTAGLVEYPSDGVVTAAAWLREAANV